jgi:hypothetical protein
LKAAASQPTIAAFRKWLRDEAAEDARRLRAISD